MKQMIFIHFHLFLRVHFSKSQAEAARNSWERAYLSRSVYSTLYGMHELESGRGHKANGSLTDGSSELGCLNQDEGN